MKWWGTLSYKSSTFVRMLRKQGICISGVETTFKCLIGRPRCEVDITSSGHVKYWIWVVFNLQALLPEFISYMKKMGGGEYIEWKIKDDLWDNMIGLVIPL
jgi:hypothetical protein